MVLPCFSFFILVDFTVNLEKPMLCSLLFSCIGIHDQSTWNLQKSTKCSIQNIKLVSLKNIKHTCVLWSCSTQSAFGLIQYTVCFFHLEITHVINNTVLTH